MHCAAWDTYRSVKHQSHSKKITQYFSYDYAALIVPTTIIFLHPTHLFFQLIHSSIRLSSIKQSTLKEQYATRQN